MDLAKRNEEMKEFFNEKAGVNFDTVHGPMMANKEAIIPHLAEGTKRVLDLGVGTGLELFPLFERFPDARVTGMDIADQMLEYLKQRPFADKLDTICGDFFSTDFGGEYDAVISSAALHHFDECDKARLYAKIFAALKPGGLFVNSDRFFETREEQLECFETFRVNPTIMRHFDTPLAIESEERLLLGAGFVDFEVERLEDKNYIVMTARRPE